MKRKNISAWVEPSLHERITTEADMKGVSSSSYAAHILSQQLAESDNDNLEIVSLKERNLELAREVAERDGEIEALRRLIDNDHGTLEQIPSAEFERCRFAAASENDPWEGIALYAGILVIGALCAFVGFGAGYQWGGR